MSSSLMDTEAGGESDQYQSIKTVTKPTSKDGGQMGDPETQVNAVDSQEKQQKAERGAKTAENVRYGQNVSESGMGGMTTNVEGSSNYGSEYGVTDVETSSTNFQDSRQSQGYGSGSGIGG